MRRVKGLYRFTLRHQLAYGLGHMGFILQQEKFVQFDWLTAVVFQLNLKYLNVKITNLLRVVLYVIFGINTTRDISKLSQI